MKLQNKIQQFISKGIGDFNALALEVFAHQFQYNEPYQRFCRAVNQTPETVQHWHQIPAVSTEVFREFDLCTLPITTAKYIFQTSGTSQDIKGKHYYHDMTLYDAAVAASFLQALSISEKSVFRILTPSFTEIPTSSLFYMFQKIVEWYGHKDSQFYMQHDHMDHERLVSDLQIDIAKNRPTILLGTAFAFVNFCDYLHDHAITLQLPKESKLLETGGLKGRTRTVSREALYQEFTAQLGLPLTCCYSEYGMTELSSQCYSKPNSHIFMSPPWMPTRIIHPETGDDVAVGEIGLVQFFDLANYTAVSAIVTSDLAIRHANSFELKGRAPKAVLRGCSTAFEK